MSSSLGRPCSHATSRPPTSQGQPPQQRQQSPSLPDVQTPPDSGPPLSRKRRSDHGLPADAKRRRHEGGAPAADDLLKTSIVIRAHPPNPLSRPYTLLPLMLLPREHLALSCLDLAAPKGDLPSAQHFQSHIRILELEGRLGSNVLIARLPSSSASSAGNSGGFSNASSIFAIERDGAGLYVLCKLGSWVDIGKLGQFATTVCQQRMPTPRAHAGTNKAEPALITPQMYKERGKKKLAIAELQSIVRRRPAAQPLAELAAGASQGSEALVGQEASQDTQPAPTAVIDAQTEAPSKEEANADLPARPPSQTLAQNRPAAPSKPAVLPTPPASDATKASTTTPQADPAGQTGPPAANDIFQNIHNQYFEALYHSMGSLAYFAKGPLSRARAAFHLDCDANLEMDDLIGFLKGLVLATAMIDKKFRETVPEIVAHLRTLGNASDPPEPKKKSKKTKKVKLGRNGLYPDEEAHIRKWWDACKPLPRDDEVLPKAEDVKYTISCLRTRETQLQMILILEILALETMRPVGDAGESQLPGMAVETTPAKKEAPKKRSKHNFPLLLDVHADRLCIWQTTTSDEVRALAESQIRPSSEHYGAQTAHSDPLKDFCVDIIVPFFSPRLPLICDSLNRKLGGPVIAPQGSRSSKAASGSTRSPTDKVRDRSSSKQQQQQQRFAKPGAVTRRTSASAHSVRNLERVLSNERLRRSVSRGPNDAIAQMRSATAAPIPGLKREMSEPAPLASIPRRSSSISSLKERPTNMLSRSNSDAASRSGSSSKVDELRARKKALVDAELQEAISALKKPNRELAGKATVEAAEKRLFSGPGQARSRPKKPTRPVAIGDRVQVKATPVSNRFRDAFVNEPGDGDGGASSQHFSQYEQDRYRSQTGRGLLFPARSQRDALATSPMVVAATPLARRIEGTPGRPSTSVPDSAVKGAPVGLAGSTAKTASRFAMSRSALLPSFPEDDEAVLPMSSPMVGRRPVSGVMRSSVWESQRLLGTRDLRYGEDVVPTSSPLQARTQPSVAAARVDALSTALRHEQMMEPTRDGNTPASPSFGAMRRSTGESLYRATLFETPTKARPLVAADENHSIMATPPVVSRPAMAVGGGNSAQTLYQQMGWDDEVDDLA